MFISAKIRKFMLYQAGMTRFNVCLAILNIFMDVILNIKDNEIAASNIIKLFFRNLNSF